MDCVIQPSRLGGRVGAISSKSVLHRLLICAALSQEETAIRGCTVSGDIAATIACLEALGAEIRQGGNTLCVSPLSAGRHMPELDCGESGSTLRFLLPVTAALGGGGFTGRGRLAERPICQLLHALAAHGMSVSASTLPLTLSGRLHAGTFVLPGDISSQYITGLLLALPLLKQESRIQLSTPLRSHGYVDITLDVLHRFGIVADVLENGFTVPGKQRYRSPGQITVEGDWTNSACFLAAGALSAPVTVTGLLPDSRQGDRAFCGLLARFGAKVKAEGESVTAAPGALAGCTIDVEQTPDIAPILAVVAAGAKGETVLKNAARLRYKESDRLHTVAAMLRALGGVVQERGDSLVIQGMGALRGGSVTGAGDHRIVMAAAVASLLCREPVIITGAQAVNKSYPQFFADFNRLGGNAVCRPS